MQPNERAVPVTIYSSAWCGYCARAKRLLDDYGVAYEEISVDSVPGARQEMMERTGRRTVPQIFIGDRHVGGCDDLMALDRAGQLVSALQGKQ